MQDATESDILGNYFVLLKYICTHTQIYMYICTYVYTHTHQLSDSNSNVTSVLPDYFPIKDHNITQVHPYNKTRMYQKKDKRRTSAYKDLQIRSLKAMKTFIKETKNVWEDIYIFYREHLSHKGSHPHLAERIQNMSAILTCSTLFSQQVNRDPIPLFLFS